MTRRIILVTGGQRSGKSGYAQRLALELSDCPVYMATSRVWDEEYRKRIERHQRDRGPQWTNIEEEKALSKHHLQGRECRPGFTRTKRRVRPIYSPGSDFYLCDQ